MTLLIRAAGASAIASAAVMVASFVIPEKGLITAFNMLLIPPALALAVAFGSRVLAISVPVAAAGVVAAVMWGLRYHDPSDEVTWLSLGSIWWLGLGLLLMPHHRRLGWFTVALAAIGAFDAYVTRAAIGQPLLALAGLKLLLSPPWAVWLGSVLLRAGRRYLGVETPASGQAARPIAADR